MQARILLVCLAVVLPAFGCATAPPAHAATARPVAAERGALSGPRIDIAWVGGELRVLQASRIAICPFNDSQHGHATASDEAGNLLVLRYRADGGGRLTVTALLIGADGDPRWTRTLSGVPADVDTVASIERPGAAHQTMATR